jgi:hypothetical protein
MFILFHQKYKYELPHPTEQLQKKLHFITNRRYEDYSIDVVGRLEPDGRFELMNKWGITNTELVENRRAYLRGYVSDNNTGSYMEIKLRPNIVFIVCFYVFLALLVIEGVGVNLVPFLSKPITLAILTALTAGMFVLILLSVNGLKKRFEQLMQLN